MRAADWAWLALAAGVAAYEATAARRSDPLHRVTVWVSR